MVWGAALGAGGEWRGPGGRQLERPGSEPVSTYGTGARILADGGWPIGYAAGPEPGRDRQRNCQFHSTKGISRFDLSIRRRKEITENSQSNRACTTDSYHSATSASDRIGRASYEQAASSNPVVHGTSDGCKRRTRRVRQTPGDRTGFDKERGTICCHFVHLTRRPQNETKLSGLGPRVESNFAQQARRQAGTRGDGNQPSQQQRKIARAGHEASRDQ